MASRPFQIMVIVFWLSTMGWLVAVKVVPTLLVGDPPLLRKMAPGDDEIVCWRLWCNDNHVGWAANRMMAGEGGLSELRSRVMIEKLSLVEMAPKMLQMLVPREVGTIDLAAQSSLQFGIDGKLLSFQSNVRLAETDAIRVVGSVDDGKLIMRVSIGDARPKETIVEAAAILGNELSPQPELMGLRMGQTWTIPVCSPFPVADSPIEILQAKVEEEEFLEWNGDAAAVKVVVYRRDAVAGVSQSDSVRSRMWVRADGKVLKQEVTLLNARLQFLRMNDAETIRYARVLREDWNSNPNGIVWHDPADDADKNVTNDESSDRRTKDVRRGGTKYRSPRNRPGSIGHP